MCYAVYVKLTREARVRQEEREMRRWIWSVLLTVAVMTALAVGASAAQVTVGNVRYESDTGTVVGPAKSGITSADIKAEITVNGTSVSITKIAARAFENCSAMTSVTIPNGITSIGDHAFASSGLRSVTIPGSVDVIQPNTFESCTNLNEVTLSENVDSIMEDAFNGCSGLEKIHFPKTLTGIDANAFAGCTNLKSVALPAGFEAVKTGTFVNCINLRTVYLPGNVKRVEVNAFSGCNNLKILHFGGTDVAMLAQEGSIQREVHLVFPMTTVKKQATCQEEGRQTTSIACDSCNGQTVYSEDRVIEKKPHTEEPIPDVPASCTQTGSTGGKRCAVPTCRAIIEKPTVVPMKDHEKETIPPISASCTAPGSKDGERCKNCGTILKQPTVVEKLEHETDEAHKATEGEVTKEATCTEKGEKTFLDTCIHCNKPVVERKEELPTVDHSYDKKQTKPFVIREATCKYSGISIPHLACDSCSAVEECTECDAIKEAVKNGAKLAEDQRAHLETHGTITETEVLKHTPKEKVEDPDNTVHGDCVTDGHIVYKETTCTVCGEKFTPDPEETEAPGEHKYENLDEELVKDATCRETGLKKVGAKKCTVCGHEVAAQEEIIPKKAHAWGTPVKDENPGEGKEDKAPTCGEEGVEYVVVSCQNKFEDGTLCGETEHRAITLPATGAHKWGEWETKEPTLTQAGEKKRVCETCGEEDVIVLPATGDTSEPEDPDNPDKPDDPSKPSEPEKPKTYQVNIVQGAGGTASANRTTAEAGDRITITISPSSGYELDMIRAIGGGTSVVSLTDLGGGRYQLTMPEASVEIRATFSRKSDGSNWANAPGEGTSGDPRRTTDVMPTQNPTQSVPRAGAYEQLFRDIPTSHWAAGEINWANQMGYMNGSGGRFNPDGNISHQQMWMVLARLTGNHPANMTEARRWAVEHSFADGSSPTGEVQRHQLVTALYRSAHLMGSTNRYTTSLAGYADSRTVPAVARDAFSWAVANGILGGTANGRLDPNGTLTRAQFAVILYRYSQKI